MGLPFSKSKVQADGEPVDASLVEEMQDGILLNRVDLAKVVGAHERSLEPLSAAKIVAGTPTYSNTTQTWTIASGDKIEIRAGLASGEKLSKLRVRCKDVASSGGVVLVQADVWTDGDTGTPIATDETSAGDGAAQWVEIPFSPAYELPNEQSFVTVRLSNTGVDPVSVYLVREVIASI